MSEPVVIRASTVNDYQTCPRMIAAKVFTADVQAAGFKIEPRKGQIGAKTGDTVHAAIAAMLTEKRDQLQFQSSIEDVLDKPLTELEEAVKEGVDFDATTKTLDQAVLQVKQQVRTYAAKVLPLIHPKLIEHKVEWKLKPGYVVRGKLDAFDYSNIVHDTKSGTRDRGYVYGLGSYMHGLEEEGEKVEGGQADWIPRSNKYKDPTFENYSARVAKDAAFAMAHRVANDHALFIETGNEYAFPAFQNSQLCSAKYCWAHGTNFCSLGRQTKGED